MTDSPKTRVLTLEAGAARGLKQSEAAMVVGTKNKRRKNFIAIVLLQHNLFVGAFPWAQINLKSRFCRLLGAVYNAMR